MLRLMGVYRYGDDVDQYVPRLQSRVAKASADEDEEPADDPTPAPAG